MNRNEYELVGEIVDPHSINNKDIYPLCPKNKVALINKLDCVVNLSSRMFKLKQKTPQIKFYDIGEPGYSKQFVGSTEFHCNE